VERLVAASDLDWTIARPSRITNGSACGYLASLDPTIRTHSYKLSEAEKALKVLGRQIVDGPELLNVHVRGEV
jgi:hypothetical protein